MNKISHSQQFKFDHKIDYSSDGIVSKQIIQKKSGNVTLFAFDKGQQLSEHSVPYDAIVQLLEGSGDIIIESEIHHLNAGESIIMPANVPHAINAAERFKMLLTMIKE